ncbi:amino acid transporter [Dendrothele bispora CBS 962.96]|uniref:Amino acid transporter n=1 Tax=Dendrothele bispora (strain CBS 962.96) TaxID=1314807 RepID=A0A4S8LWY2_DENBC|nr:amino acid transporter [Dendrothele bispora CBS 962.96]
MEDSNTDLRANEDLHKLGYEQEMSRTRGLSHILFMTLAIMAVPFGLSAPFATGLVGGGPVAIIWGWVFVSVFTMTIALSLAEISAKYPTSAGAYYWCFRLAKRTETGLLASWICGWFIMVGVWTISLSVTFGTAQLLVAGVGIFQTEWEATTWQTYLIFLAVLFFSTGIGIFCNKILPTLDVKQNLLYPTSASLDLLTLSFTAQILSAYWTLLGTLVICICLSAKAAVGRRSASFALGDFDPSQSGWTPGWSFFIGLLPPAYTYSAIGMITNMAEEVHNPTKQLPRAIVYSIPIGFITGIFFLLPILFTLPDISILLSVTNGQPIALMFTLIMGNRGGGFGLWFIVFGIGMFCAISICCAASRATWAFARDKAIPCHSFFSKVNPHLSDVPMNAYILSTTIQLLLGLIYLGSSAAFNAFVGVAVICLGASYAIPVGMSLWHGREDVKDSPYPLGRWGYFINVIAVLWILFEIVLFSMPAVIPVTKSSMNYASVVFVGFAVISGVWYMISGRYHYNGPPVPADQVISGSSPTSSIPDPGEQKALKS